MQRKTPKTYTEEQKKFIINDVQTKHRTEGRGIFEGCEANGISPSNYYGWLKQRAGMPARKKKAVELVPAAKPVHHTFPIEAAPATVRGQITIQGDPVDIGHFLRALARGAA